MIAMSTERTMMMLSNDGGVERWVSMVVRDRWAMMNDMMMMMYGVMMNDDDMMMMGQVMVMTNGGLMNDNDGWSVRW